MRPSLRLKRQLVHEDDLYYELKDLLIQLDLCGFLIKAQLVECNYSQVPLGLVSKMDRLQGMVDALSNKEALLDS